MPVKASISRLCVTSLLRCIEPYCCAQAAAAGTSLLNTTHQLHHAWEGCSTGSQQCSITPLVCISVLQHHHQLGDPPVVQAEVDRCSQDAYGSYA